MNAKVSGLLINFACLLIYFGSGVGSLIINIFVWLGWQAGSCANTESSLENSMHSLSTFFGF